MAGRSVARIARGVTSLGVVLGLLAFAPATAALPAPPVHFGLLGPFGSEGDLAWGAAIIRGSKAAQLAVNEAGGILGRELALDAGDTSGEVEEAGPMINKLIGVDHAVAVVGPTTAVEYYAVRPVFTQDQVPDLMLGGDVSLDHEADPFFWRDRPSDSIPGIAMALYARRLGYARGAMMMLAGQSSDTLKGSLTQAFRKLGGEIVADVVVQPGQTSYGPEVLRVINARPDVIFTGTDPVSAGLIFASFREMVNLTIPFIGTDMTAGDDYLQAITYQVAHDHLISVAGAPMPDRGAFRQDYNRLFPDQEPPANAAYAYDAVISVALAIDRAGSTDGPQINAAMMTVTNPPGTPCEDYADCLRLLRAGTKITYEGASGSLDYNQYHNVLGVYGALRADPRGQLQWIAVMSESELAEASP
jgi:branched-chain amino acid transport system substrate-binding protein